MTEAPSIRTFTIENEEYKNTKADNMGGRFAGAGFHQVAAKAGRRLLNATGKKTAQLKLRETTTGSPKKIHVYNVKLQKLKSPVTVSKKSGPGKKGTVNFTITDKVVVTSADSGYSALTPKKFKA